MHMHIFRIMKAYVNSVGSVFEQLARYTMRYQESELHLGLYSSWSSSNFDLLSNFFSSTNFTTLLYFYLQVQV